jgi:type IV pilus assembly protein PilP
MTLQLNPGSSFRLVAVTSSLALLTACFSSNADLDRYIEEVKARPATEIEPLPQIKHIEGFLYAEKGRRDPFDPSQIVEQMADGSTESNTGVKPPDKHIKEELEQYPLDTLRMVGTMSKDDQTWALVKSQDATIHRVKPGNYMGQNYGQITHISDEKIELTEIVSNGRGGYIERPATVGLADSQ